MTNDIKKSSFWKEIFAIKSNIYKNIYLRKVYKYKSKNVNKIINVELF